MTSEDQIKAVLAKHIKPWEMDGFPCVTGIPEAAAEIAALASTAGAGAGDGSFVIVRPDEYYALLRLFVDTADALPDIYDEHPEAEKHILISEALHERFEAAEAAYMAAERLRTLGVGQSPAVPASPRSGAGDAARVCHDEQMTVWTTEIAGNLAMGGYLREDLSYDDGLAVHAAIGSDLRSIIESAFTHPELSQGSGAGRSERAVEIRELSEKATEGPWHVDMFPYRDVETGEPQPPQCEGICTHDEADGLAESVATCGERDAKFIVALVNAYRSGELVHRSEIAGRSEKGEGEGDWRGDPSADERWNDGLDYGMTQFCAVLGVDPQKVTWDAATETVSGDVRAVICNILNAWAGDDWRDRPKEHLSSTAIAALREIKALQGEQTSDKYKKDRAHLIACRALGSLRTAPAQSPSTSDREG